MQNFLYLVLFFFRKPSLVLKYVSTILKFNKIKSGDIVFVFPFFHTGGAEKVHFRISQIAKSNGLICSFIFTETSKIETYKSKFQQLGLLIDISFRYKNEKINGLLKKKLIKSINSKNIIVFSCNKYFYNLISDLENTLMIDLIHSFDPPFEISNLNYKSVYHKFNKRIFINNQALLLMKEVYNSYKIQGVEKLELIHNSPFEIENEPDTFLSKPFEDKLEIIFVSRNSSEKRPHLVFELAKLMNEEYPDKFNFIMIGDFENFKSKYNYENISTYTGLHDVESIIPYYQRAHVLVLTSETEGFPMAISEAMFHSVLPVSTDVGGISDIINSGINGILISNTQDELSIVNQFKETLLYLFNEKNKREEMTIASFNSAKLFFSAAEFENKYTNLFLNKNKIGRY